MVKSPAPDNPTDGLQRFRAGRGQEGVSIEIAMPDRLPGSKRVAKKVERLVRVVPTPVRILAVDDLRLLRRRCRPPSAPGPSASARCRAALTDSLYDDEPP